MLNDIEKQKIREEEIFRNEIQNEIKSSKKRRKLWKFLNSPFGLWILTTISVGYYLYYKS